MLTSKTKKSQQFSGAFKQRGNEFWGLFKLIGKSFYADPRGPIFLYVVPIFFMVLFYYVIGSSYEIGNEGKVSLLFSYTLLPGLTILTGLAPTIVEWKRSIFLQRINIAGVKKSFFLLALWSFYFCAGLSGILLQFLIALGLGNTIFIEHLPSVEWGYFILGVVFTIILAIAIATFLGGVFSNQGVMYGITMMIYFLSIFFSGIMLFPPLFEKVEAIRILTYLIPHKYSTFLILLAQDPMGLKGYFNVGGIPPDSPHAPDFTAIWQIVVGALLFIAAFFALTTFTFKWSAKK